MRSFLKAAPVPPLQRGFSRAFSSSPHVQKSLNRKLQKANEELLEFLREEQTAPISGLEDEQDKLLEFLKGKNEQDGPLPDDDLTQELLEEAKKETVGAKRKYEFESGTQSQAQLPPSPLTDARLSRARLQYKEAKSKAPHYRDLGHFRKRLYKNPYAQALASPLRHCSLTGAHLPKDFLISFGLVTDPRTGHIWQTPRFLADRHRSRPGKDKDAEAQEVQEQEAAELESQEPDQPHELQMGPQQEYQNIVDDDDPSPIDLKAIDESLDHQYPFPNNSFEKTMDSVPDLPELEPSDLPPSQQKEQSDRLIRTMASMNVLSTHRAMRTLTSYNKRKLTLITPPTWTILKRDQPKGIILREDMSDFILQQLRVRIAEEIQRVAGHEFVEVWEGRENLDLNVLDHVQQMGAVIMFRPLEKEQEEKNARGQEEEKLENEAQNQIRTTTDPEPATTSPRTPPPTPTPYNLIRWRRKYIPLYDIQTLLGPVLASQAHEPYSKQISNENNGAGTPGKYFFVVIKAKRRTADFQKRLWQLMGYLGEGADVRWDKRGIEDRDLLSDQSLERKGHEEER